MGEVVELDVVTRLDIPAERVLRQATEDNLESAVVIGYRDGEFYFASSLADGGDVLWLLELAKRKLFETADEISGE
jgi:hypothetical protein